MGKEYAYWMALAHTKGMTNERKNRIIVQLHEKNSTIIDFFHEKPSKWIEKYGLTEKEHFQLSESASELPNYSFLAEDMINQGYQIIPLTSTDFSSVMKTNMKTTYAPQVIYIKGNKQILQEDSIAIVGSRKANDISLTFTDNVAKMASNEYKVVVSGFAKGVDKQALDSALKYKGQSIIVLPQGIDAFKSGFKKYYKQIVDGDVLVLSTFHPKATWSVQLAMARNPIIYGLAREIYVAESFDSGGTWSGVKDGLKKGRIIYVRYPGAKEKNSNLKLLSMGGLPLDLDGKPLDMEKVEYKESSPKPKILNEPGERDFYKQILELLSQGEFTSGEILKYVNADVTTAKLTKYLKAHKEVEVVGANPYKFRLSTVQRDPELF